ncbi:PLP-dependent transferase [Prochlorococcus sp. MIT 0601]|uniref:PLP-dependent transferase n=1 Tax=Prochlorococcus sp. MIT 0601 TaxID=1499498 RepID=UPI000533978C|nr:PLP-dependent transferase [Prochlorococcus sp. MIT 0601]KGG12993.1 Cystathionine gamma-synthase [Prochlorococcus sp. MIT 0601]
MTERNLLLDPYWEARDTGKAIPQSPHAVSVALPLWRDVIAYEENDPACMATLQSIYPRFGLNPIVAQIANRALSKSEQSQNTCWPYPNLPTAKKARQYCKSVTPNAHITIKEESGLFCLIVDEHTTPTAKAFWQHTGLGASSRQAAIALNQEKSPLPSDGERARELIRNRLAHIYGCESSLIHIHPSGMAALTTALEALNRLSFNKASFQVGFPYVDVLKLPEKIFNGSELSLTKDPCKLEIELDQKRPSALIVELPSNPMLQCVDLPLISKLAHQRGIPVIADDTIGSPVNIDALPYADLIFSSLTKSFAGRGDILAGSLVISPHSKWKQLFQETIPNSLLAELSDSDSIALEKASKDVHLRINELNNSCLVLKRNLEDHPDVKRVFHPEHCSNFKSLMRPKAGFGCLLSLELFGGLAKTKRFYNSLKVCKGPSLGTNFTLACPYVLLAHYQELKWAEECGVPSNLLRISVGLEKPSELWERFKTALNT